MLIFILSCSDKNEIFVAPDGSDMNPGTKSRSLSSVYKALELVAKDNRDKIIYLREGTYYLDSTLPINRISNLVIRPYKNEKVIFTGAKKIRGFKRLHKKVPGFNRIQDSVRAHIYYVDLRSLGIHSYGQIKPRGFRRKIMPSGLMLYFNGHQMTIARWPNRGWLHIHHVPESLNGKGFAFAENRPSKWHQPDRIWMHGYWKWNWADAYVKIQRIDTVRKHIHIAEPQSPYPYTAGGRFYFFNILEELDTPGEWYLDRNRGILYFYPPSDLKETDEIYVSILDSFMIVMKDARHVRIENIGFMYANHGGVEILRGKNNLIKNCRFRHLNTLAVRIGKEKKNNKNDRINGNFGDAGNYNGITGCEISDCGEGGIMVGGGHRATLQAGNNYVENCKIYKTATWVKTYRPGIYVLGVGNRIARNEIYDLPHSAVLFKGNEHLIEYNNIYRVCTETADAGAIYTGRDWTGCGHVIRYNYIHDLRVNIKKSDENFTDVIGVYLDDFTSGIEVFGNIFYKAGRSLLIGGGRNNHVRNNIFIEGNPALHIDARGTGWGKRYFPVLIERYHLVDANRPRYSERYPFLKNLLEDQPEIPKYNCVETNVFCKGNWLELLDGLQDSIVCFRNNVVKKDSCDFFRINRNRIKIDFNSKIFPPGFERIPVERIGVNVKQKTY